MPIQAPQWTEYLSCPVCENAFELRSRLPISISTCGHTVCKACLSTLQRRQCPFDQCPIESPIENLPVNTALVLLVDHTADLEKLRPTSNGSEEIKHYIQCIKQLESLATHLRPVTSANGSTAPTQLSRPMQRKLVSLINCQLLEANGRSRAIKAARSLGERTVTELILQHQNPQQLSANLWAAVRARGCQFLGPAMQEEVLKLVLLALEDGSALSRKVLVMFVVQKLEPQFPQASKTSIGHVVQLLYRASCFKVTKRDGDSSLMQLKEEFRTYDALRREHDAQIVQIATEAGLRIAPDQWSSLLYGDPVHKSHMQSIIDKLQTPQSFVQSVQELVIALQRTGDPGHLTALRPHLDHLAAIAIEVNDSVHDWTVLAESLSACCSVVSGLLAFITLHSNKRLMFEDSVGPGASGANSTSNARYKTSMCRDLAIHGSCPRGKNCTFAHSMAEIETYRNKNQRPPSGTPPGAAGKQMASPPPVAQVAPVPRNNVTNFPQQQQLLQQQQQQQQPQQQPLASVIVQPPPSQTPAGLFNVPVAVPPPMAIVYQEMSPPAPDHMEELRRNQSTTPVDTQPPGALTTSSDEPHREVTSLVTKSLSALKSRKEQIIDTLEDNFGRDEMERVTKITQERAKGGKSIGALSMAISDTPNEPRGPAFEPRTSVGAVTSPTQAAAGSNSSEVSSVSNYGYFAASVEDELIPWSDTPQVSRFGPISRRGTSITRPSKPSATLAAMDDETNPTAVVRHSKQMSKQLPPTASLILQNGGRTALQPVAVGANGEIGYIAVAEGVALPEPVVAAPVAIAEPVTIQPQEAAAVDYVYAESERMKHELVILQQKISDLNVAQQNYQIMHHQQLLQQQQQHQQHQQQQQQQQTQQQLQLQPPGSSGLPVSTSYTSLTSELQLIEKTIIDREMELQINTCMQKESPQGLDYGSYIAHGLMESSRPWERPTYNTSVTPSTTCLGQSTATGFTNNGSTNH